MDYDPGVMHDMRCYLQDATPYEVIAEGIWKDKVMVSFLGFKYGVEGIIFYPDGSIEIVAGKKLK